MSERSIAQAVKPAASVSSNARTGLQQRQCACGHHTMREKCEQCKKKCQVKTEAKIDADTWKVKLERGAKLYTYSGQYGTLNGGAALAQNLK